MSFDPAQLRHIEFAASLAEIEDVSALLPFAEASCRTAGEMFDASGKPRMLRVTAWMAHAGKPNKNGDAFLAEDLREAVEQGLATDRYPLMLDFNHDFTPYGVWTRATYGFDRQAGENGVLLEGAVWAWRFPELADTLLAEQQRHGFIRVSMACMGQWYEDATTADGDSYTIIRKPVFFANSVLNQPQADPNARGLGSEDPEETHGERTQLLVASETLEWFEGEVTWELSLADFVSADVEERSMSKEIKDALIAEIKAAMGEVTEEQVAELKQMLEAASRVPQLEADLADVTRQLEVGREAHALLEQERDGEVTKTAELETAAAEMELKVTHLEEQLAQANEELSGFRAEKAEREAAEAEAAAVALREARLAQLPESVRTSLAAMEEEKRERVVAHWLSQDEEEWTEVTLAGFALAPEAPSYTQRSTAEGTLITQTELESTKYAIDKFVK